MKVVQPSRGRRVRGAVPGRVHNLDVANQGRPREVGISAREAEVLAALGEHLTNAEIGARLFISIRTVESHVSSLLRKLGADDRRALAALAESLPEGGVAAALPSPLTPFVGRAAERAALSAALAEHRLVTAVGPGGVGKTRLALSVAAEVSDRFADGASWPRPGTRRSGWTGSRPGWPIGCGC
jgi:DNA-binding CsgD family transcriptional regulator